MIGGLSPLVRLRDFSFGRMWVRVVGGYQFSMKQLSYIVHSNTVEFFHSTRQFGDASLTGGGFRLPLPLEIELTSMQGGSGEWYRYDEEIVLVDEYGDLASRYSWTLNELPIFTTLRRQISRLLELSEPRVLSLGSVLYDPLPDVLAHLDHFGERLEVWLETEMSGGSREWRRLFRSAPAAQVSIAALQDAGYVDGDGYVTQLDSAGQLPVYGRNALGPFSVVDTFRPANQ